jgi:dTDP-4-dehydrorhamnose 3,5-epimerase
LNVTETELPGVLVIEPKVFGDARGFFMETYNAQRYAKAGIPARFVQDNLSSSRRGVLRGLHFQNPHGQEKLVQVLEGEVFDVAVDIRLGSPTFGRWVGTRLSGTNRHQFYVPAGFAHGFCTLSDRALFAYKCSDLYHPEAEGSILWSDSDIGIQWPVDQPVLSAKDAAASRLREVDTTRLPSYQVPA